MEFIPSQSFQMVVNILLSTGVKTVWDEMLKMDYFCANGKSILEENSTREKEELEETTTKSLEWPKWISQNHDLYS